MNDGLGIDVGRSEAQRLLYPLLAATVAAVWLLGFVLLANWAQDAVGADLEGVGLAIYLGAFIVVLSALAVALVWRRRPTGASVPATTAPVSAASGSGDSLTGRQVFVLFTVLPLMIFAPAAAVVGAAKLLDANNARTFRPEILLPVILLVGLVSLLIVLTVLVAVFRRFQLTSRDNALGLPQGSIQAVLALGLVLIFAIIGVYLHGAEGSEVRTSAGLTRAQVDALPPASIVKIHKRAPNKFDVQQSVSAANPQQDDLSKQLLTTISTLVVAIAGFYFGSKSVKEATDSAVAAVTGGPTVTVADGQEDGEDAGGSADETSQYGEQSSATGLSASDVEAELSSPPLEEDQPEQQVPDPGLTDTDGETEEVEEPDAAADNVDVSDEETNGPH